MSENEHLVGPGMVVSFHYRLTDDGGNEIDDSHDRPPLPYLHGAGNIVPGLERALAGHRAGDKLDVVVPPEEAYGPRVGGPPQPLPRSMFPPDLVIVPGMQFDATDQDGRPLLLWVTDVQGDQVYVDQNHPLAGVTLHFEVEIVEVRPAEPEELAHGHPHVGAFPEA